jgi:hypothetical protein
MNCLVRDGVVGTICPRSNVPQDCSTRLPTCTCELCLNANATTQLIVKSYTTTMASSSSVDDVKSFPLTTTTTATSIASTTTTTTTTTLVPSEMVIDVPTLAEPIDSPADFVLIGAAVGGSVGAIFLFAAIAIVCVAVRRRRRGAAVAVADSPSGTPVSASHPTSTIYQALSVSDSQNEYSAVDLVQRSRYDDASELQAD